MSKIIATVTKAATTLAAYAYNIKTKAIIEISSRTKALTIVQTGRTKLEYVTGLFFLAYIKIFGDNTSISDSASKQTGKGVQETVNISETDFTAVGKNTVDTTNFSESDKIDYGKATADTTNISESDQVLIGKNAVDTTNFSESDVVDFGKGIADATNFAESTAAVFGRSTSDTTNFSESDVVDFNKAATDTANTSDIIATQSSKNIADQVNFTDDINGAAVDDDQNVFFFKNNTETFSAQDSLQSLLQYFRDVSETTNISESDSIQLVKNSLETLNFSEADVVALNKNVTESVNLTDSVAAVTGFARVVSDTTNISSSGLVIIQDYTTDNNYFAEDFVGQSATIT